MRYLAFGPEASDCLGFPAPSQDAVQFRLVKVGQQHNAQSAVRAGCLTAPRPSPDTPTLSR